MKIFSLFHENSTFLEEVKNHSSKIFRSCRIMSKNKKMMDHQSGIVVVREEGASE